MSVAADIAMERAGYKSYGGLWLNSHLYACLSAVFSMRHSWAGDYELYYLDMFGCVAN